MKTHTETTSVYDPKLRCDVAVTVSVTAPDLVIDALTHDRLTLAVLADETYGAIGRKLTIDVTVKRPKR